MPPEEPISLDAYPSDRSPAAPGCSDPAHADSESEIEAMPVAPLWQESEQPVSGLDEKDGQGTSVSVRFRVQEPAGPDRDPTAVEKETGARSEGDHYRYAPSDEPSLWRSKTRRWRSTSTFFRTQRYCTRLLKLPGTWLESAVFCVDTV